MVQITQILDGLMENSIAWLLLAVVAIISLFIGIVGLVKGSKKKELSYYCKTNKIIRAGKTLIPKIDLKYDNKDIDDLSITRIVIWNSGNDVLNENDMVEKKPLSIVSKNSETIILECNSIKENEAANEFRISKQSDTNVKIGFTYLEMLDGVVVQILHSGSIEDLEITGKIKGGKIRSAWKKTKKKNVKARRKLFVAMCIVLIIMLWLLLLDCIITGYYRGWTFIYKFYVIFIPIYDIVMTMIIIKMIKRELFMYVPSAFRSEFMEDEVET